MIAEGRGGADILAVDAAAAARGGFPAWRLDAGAERGEPQRALDLGGDRPGAVALVVGDIFQRGATQASAGREI